MFYQQSIACNLFLDLSARYSAFGADGFWKCRNSVQVSIIKMLEITL